MDPVLIIVLVGAAWLLLKGGLGGTAVPPGLAATIGYNQQSAMAQLQNVPQRVAQSTQVQVAGVESGLAAEGAQVFSGVPVVGTLLAIGSSMLAAHTARVAGATAENAGIDNIVPAFDADLQAINVAWKAGQVGASAAVTALSQVHDNYWNYMAQFQGKPGVANRGCPGGQVGGPIGKGGCTSGQPICDKTCTAGCCVGCSAINGALANAIWAIQAGYHGPVAVCAVFGSKFGAHDRAGYQMSW